MILKTFEIKGDTINFVAIKMILKTELHPPLCYVLTRIEAVEAPHIIQVKTSISQVLFNSLKAFQG